MYQSSLNEVLQFRNLKNKGLPDSAIEEIVTNELVLTAHHRDMKRKYWQKFLVHKGQNYDWTSFKVQYGQSYIPPGVPLCGLQLIIYCENYFNGPFSGETSIFLGIFKRRSYKRNCLKNIRIS